MKPEILRIVRAIAAHAAGQVALTAILAAAGVANAAGGVSPNPSGVAAGLQATAKTTGAPDKVIEEVPLSDGIPESAPITESQPANESFGTAKEKAFAVSGYYGLETAYTYASPAHWSRAVNRLQLEAQGSLSGSVTYKLGVRADVDPVYYGSNFYLPAVKKDAEQRAVLEAWMRSLKPEELFDANGRLVPELKELAPEGARRMSANPKANGGILKRALALPEFGDYALKVDKPGTTEHENVRLRGKRPEPSHLGRGWRHRSTCAFECPCGPLPNA